jgi:hypothetical protein
MTQPKDDLIPHFVALQRLRETEQRLGIEPLQRADDCPQPSDLLKTALGEAGPDLVARVEAHAAECAYCSHALRALKTALANEPLPELPEDAEDPAARWLESDEPVTRRPPPAPAAAGETPIAQGTSLGYTELFRNPAQWPVLLERVGRWLPHLLRRAEVPDELAGEVLARMRSQLGSTDQTQRFSPALLRWVTEVAEAHGLGAQARSLTDESIRAAVEEHELEQVLAHADPHELPEQTRFREAARRYCRDLRALSAFTPEDLAVEDYANYQEQLVIEAEERTLRELADVLA